MKKTSQLIKAIFSKLGYAVLALFVVMALSCSSSSKDPGQDPGPGPGPDPGPGKTADDIAKEDLIVYFSFDGEAKDAKNNMTDLTVKNITYVDGIKGKAAVFDGANSFVFCKNDGGKVQSLTSFTYSIWINSGETKTVPLYSLQFGEGKAGNFGPFHIMTEGYNDESHPGTIRFKVRMDAHRKGVSWANQWLDPLYFRNAFDKWTHVVLMYDETTSKFQAFHNGKGLELDEGMTNRYAGPKDPLSEEQVPLGPLNFFPDGYVFGGITIGTSIQKALETAEAPASGWHANVFNGKMDELRIYKRPLTALEVLDLYELEKKGK